jgi:hypothetical protein
VRVQSAAAQQPAPSPTFGTTVVIPSGLRGDVYLIREKTTVLPAFERRNLKAEGTIWTTSLDIPPRRWREGFPGITKRFEWFAINYTGPFWIGEPGRYAFALLSDDGANLYIDDQLVIDNDCQHPPAVRAARVTLSGGIHRIRVPYFQGPRDCVALILAVAGPDGEWRLFSTDAFKPPPNPEDWKYVQAANPALELETDDAPPAVNELLRALGEDTKAAASFGCVAYPTRDCGK